MMKMYLAAKYDEKHYMRLVRDKLEDMGHEITSRWLSEEEAPSVQVHEVDETRLFKYAHQDLEDIEASDCLVQFQQKSSPNVRGGALVERGIAIGSGKLVVVVGSKVNIFDFIDTPSLLHFDDLEEFFEWAVGEAYAEAPPIDIEDFTGPTDAMVGVTSEPDRCWCGEELVIEGIGDFIDDERAITMHYACPVHGQYYDNPRGIAISGKARGGKDSFAAILSARLGWPVTHLADSLKKEFYADRYPVEYSMNDTEDIVEEVDRMKSEDPGIRQKLIDHGQWRRGQNENYWIKRIDSDVVQIVADCRFGNEHTWFREHGFMVIRINATEETRIRRGQGNIDDISETDLDGSDIQWDKVIDNDSTLDVLADNADDVVRKIRSKEKP